MWFHGGGIEAGQKEIPEKLKNKGYVVIGANYGLLPKVTIDKTLDDAAEAVAWAFRHAAEYGGDPKKIVVIVSRSSWVDTMRISIWHV